MNDETKEILDKLNKLEYDDIHLIICEVISRREIKILLDYITNLREENERLKEENKRIFSKVNDDELLISNAMNYAEAQDYKSRCEKAIQFIKEKISSTQGVINDYMYHKEHNKILIELLQEDIEMYKKELNILNGGDE